MIKLSIIELIENREAQFEPIGLIYLVFALF